MTKAEHVFIQNGIRTEWDDDTITITEEGFPHTATLDNQGNILSSTFGKDGISFLNYYWGKIMPMITDLRNLDRQYANA
ncbi:hypothetical protein CRD60_05155 [Bifidobacterium aemilianum]|uniref:Uncharacterized protein n=1 Tax=Bifidobacterium aemilianum TaxID=2493120 RepID=A0A366K927_9BIFI|nr:hypothetical protein [Bifidobacterium aemilianum]RBP97633.1 hypothetical protein CRD60_05155 [Bifidobacterium aemilianum]